MFGLAASLLILATGFIERADSYAFIHSNRPFVMEVLSGVRWTSYTFDEEPQSVIGPARRELLAKGFKEDFTERPWFKFRKGNKEVIICAMGELGVDAGSHGKLVHVKPTTKHKRAYAFVWLGNPGSQVQLVAFEVKKFISQR